MNNKTNKLLITGAGFSYNFNLPTTALVIDQIEQIQNSNNLNAYKEDIKKYFEEKIITEENIKYNKNIFFTFEETLSFWNLEIMYDYLQRKIRNGNKKSIIIYKKLSYLLFRILQDTQLPNNLSTPIEIFLSKNLKEYDFISTNWDIILDQLLNNYHNFELDYGIKINLCNGQSTKKNEQRKLIKFHGSTNWMICENCKELFCKPDYKIVLETKCGLIKNPNIYINEDKNSCKHEQLKMVAKFYGKNKLNSPQEIFSKIKKEAKKLLKNNNNWLFIGYSFPDDDVEFINLLKNSCNSKKEIDIVYMCNDRNKKFELNCRNIFIDANRINLFPDGLENYIENLNQ